MQVTTTGRHSGQPRSVILAFIEDGPNLVTMAMNGWDPAEPAWWLNLLADPHAVAVLPDGSSHAVIARAADGDEHDRLWSRYRLTTAHLDAYAARRGTKTAIVILEPDVSAGEHGRPQDSPRPE
jgi:deazaflavin-dependent oxidoreductase (nitroreductase family)